MTVGEWFEGDAITRESVDAMADESPYYEKAANFISTNWETDVDDLSVAQSGWAGKILDDLVERRISRQRRPRF